MSLSSWNCALYRMKTVAGSALAAAVILLVPGCNRMSPEERLDRIAEDIQQRDFMSAELEARKLVDKFPDDPAAVQGHLMLFNIYRRDGRLDDALAELDILLQKIPLTDKPGFEFLKDYNEILKIQKRYDEAFRTIEKYEKQYAADKIVLLNLNVAKIDVKTAAGQTSEARTLLAKVREETTVPGALIQFRGLEIATYFRDDDATGALKYVESEYAKTKDLPILGRDALVHLLGLHAQLGHYDETRKALQDLTNIVDSELDKELDTNIKRNAAIWLGNLHSGARSYPSAAAIFQSVFDSTNDANMVQYVVREGFEAFLKMKKVDEAFKYGEHAAKRFPEFEKNLSELKTLRETPKWQTIEDTSTMALRFREEPTILPRNLPSAKDRETTGASVGGGRETTGTGAATAANAIRETTGAMAAGGAAAQTSATESATSSSL